MNEPDRASAYRAHVQERGQQLRQCSKGVKFNLADNHRADPNAKDLYAERAKFASRGSARQKSAATHSVAAKRDDVILVSEDFRKALRQWRKETGLSKRDAASELGIGGETALSGLEKPNRRRMPKSQFDRICQVIGFGEAEE